MRPQLVRARRPAVIAACAATFTACSGSGFAGTPATLGAPPRVVQALQRAQPTSPSVSFSIGIRPKPKPGPIGPRYISVSTQSLQILVDGKDPVVVNLTPTSPNCAPNPNLPGSYICTATLHVTTGDHVFTLTAYDRINATGTVLSTNSTGKVFVKPVGTTIVSIVLEGIVHDVILSLANQNPPVGTPATIALTTTLLDADGNLIIGPALYENAVTLTTSDAANGPLSKTLLKSPADAAGITVAYSGAKVGSITYAASATGLAPAGVVTAVLSPGSTIPGVVEYTVPTAGSYPFGIAAGSDGAMWFTEIEGGKIGRITTAGAITEFPLPAGVYAYPDGIAAGPDGALWFTEDQEGTGYIGRITTAGSITEFTIPNPNSQPMAIALGSDGALWFTEIGNAGLAKIGRITTAGVITEYPTPTTNSAPEGIAAGPDGALWFSETGAGRIGRITTAGAFKEYVIPAPASSATAIAAGPDGALWFTEPNANQMGRITTAGAFSELSMPVAGSEPAGVAAGPDGAIWITQFGGYESSPIGLIGRITTARAITENPIPTAAGGPYGIAAGPGNTMWFTEQQGKIGKFSIAPPR